MRSMILLGFAAVFLMTGLGGCAGDGACCSGCGGAAVEPVAPAAPPGAAVYRCPHDGGTRSDSGPCPKCGMALDGRHRASR